MRIIISPAKQMRTDTDIFACIDVPVFPEKTLSCNPRCQFVIRDACFEIEK